MSVSTIIESDALIQRKAPKYGRAIGDRFAAIVRDGRKEEHVTDLCTGAQEEVEAR